jgi:5'-3' exonuclease
MNKYQQLFKQLQKEKENNPSEVNDHIMIFDGLNTFIRAFGATPSTNEDGEHIGGITGFLFSIGKAIRDFKPSRCIIVFDGKGGSARRKSIYKEYKGNRANKTRLRRHDHHFAEIEDEQEAMRHQFSRLVSYLDNLPVTFIAIDGIEADDTITYIADMYSDICKKMTIVSTDRDFYQLINDQIQIWSPIKKKMYDVETLVEEFGVHPNNYVVYRTFTGDNSDNIPGVNGFGTKTILKCVPELAEEQEFTIDDLFLKSETLSTDAKTGKKYKTILESKDIIEKNYELMNLKSLDIPGTCATNIRNIINAPIPLMNKMEFQRLFMQDKMWSTMKNLPEWLNSTWLSLNAFAQQTHK